MSTQATAGAYEPRRGDRVTVRRYIQSAVGGRTLSSERSGEITNMFPQADGFRIWLDGDPEWIFTGYQFLGAGGDGPASLVTEIELATEGAYRQQVSPELAVTVDPSQCIVLEVSDGQGRVRRRVTVTDVDALKAALDKAREEQRRALAGADNQRVMGRLDRLQAEGKLTKREAVQWLADRGFSRQRAIKMTSDLRAGAAGGPLSEGMTYDGTYWRVPPDLFTTADRDEIVNWLMRETGRTKVHVGAVVNRAQRHGLDSRPWPPEPFGEAGPEQPGRTWMVSYSGGYWHVTAVQDAAAV